MHKSLTVTLLFMITLSMMNPIPLPAKKIRLSGNAAWGGQNNLLSGTGLGYGLGLHLAYPISEIHNPVNIELSIANWLNRLHGGDDSMTLFRFGFGIRVFLNVFEGFRPYFTHDITSHIISLSNRAGHASTYGILLGLGVDIPLQIARDSHGESSSIYIDCSYNRFTLSYFELPEYNIVFWALSIGYSWNLF